MLGCGLKYLTYSLPPTLLPASGSEFLLPLTSGTEAALLLLLLVKASMRTEDTLITVFSSGIMSPLPQTTTCTDIGLEYTLILEMSSFKFASVQNKKNGGHFGLKALIQKLFQKTKKI